MGQSAESSSAEPYRLDRCMSEWCRLEQAVRRCGNAIRWTPRMPELRTACFSLLVVASLLFNGALSAQDSNLAQRQASVAERYQHLEDLLLRLADVEATENPERSALLRRAARQSRDQFVLNKIQSASESLRSQQFQDAVENQGSASEGLQAMLKLLLSEDRSKRIRDEKERIANLIKDLKRIERAQRSTRARTEGGADVKEVLKEQESIADRSEELKNDLSQSSAADESASQVPTETKSPKDPQSSEDKNDSKQNNTQTEKEQGPQKQDDTKKDSESKPSDSPKPSGKSDSKSNPSESKPSQPSESQPSESQPSESQPSESQPSESQPSEQQSPQSQQPQSPEQQAEQQLKQAIEKMRQAEQELEDAKRDKATEKQREAEENLRQAIDRLEKILRQLREEEMQRELARLEARFRKMAEMQSKVLDDTVTLSATPKAQRNRQTDLKSGELAFEEKKITLEADRAMLLLREEGSSVAFPEVVSQIRDDTMRVTDRLGQSKIDAVTQGIQQDILAALEEMIEALQKAQRESGKTASAAATPLF